MCELQLFFFELKADSEMLFPMRSTLVGIIHINLSSRCITILMKVC